MVRSRGKGQGLVIALIFSISNSKYMINKSFNQMLNCHEALIWHFISLEGEFNS